MSDNKCRRWEEDKVQDMRLRFANVDANGDSDG